MARVSVVIPAYNGARFLRPALESVLAQKGLELDVAVVDDASTDETPLLVARFPRLRYLRNPRNLGLAANFRRCLEASASAYTCLFCQDDLMEPGNLARKVARFDAEPGTVLVFSNARFIDDSGVPAPRLWNHDLPADSTLRGRDFLRRLILLDNPVALSGAVFRTELAREAGGFDVRFAQALDWHLWMRLSLRGGAAYLADPLVRYRDHPETATRKREPFLNIADVYAAKIDVLRRHADQIPGARLLEDQFRTHFGKGLLASSARCWSAGERELARALLALAWRVAPGPAFLPKAILLGALQALLRKRIYPCLRLAPAVAWNGLERRYGKGEDGSA